ncbi:MAG: hypothetical protein RIR79_115 [Pseudomonadota bacterium]|jgi:predicted metalloprotease
MKTDKSRASDNVEDRRSTNTIGTAAGRGNTTAKRAGVITVMIATVGGWLLGVSPTTVMNFFNGGAAPTQQVQQYVPPPPPKVQPDDEMKLFVKKVLGDTEDVWRDVFTKGGSRYQDPKLVLFRGHISTACGKGESAMGPFYCPADQKVYIDLGFYETLKKELGAPGDFAQAYVIAHEVGHHVQNLLGISAKVESVQARATPAEANALSVRLELQADCFAGVWAHHANNARQLLEKGDVEEAMNAAAKIGDDALQRGSGNAVIPESFTHGSSAQRQKWFLNGLKNGSVKGCDTFSVQKL